MADLPQFKSLDEALRWVYGAGADGAGNTVAPPAFSRMQGRDRREFSEEPEATSPRYDLERRPRGRDASGLAGMVRSYVSRQPQEVRAHLFAWSLRGRVRRMAIARLGELIADKLDCGMVEPDVVYQLCLRFYGDNVKFIDIQRRHKLGRYRLATIWRRVWITLDAVRGRTEGPITDYLRDKGLIL